MSRLSPEVKLNAVLEVVSGQSLIAVCQKYGCSRQTLAAWVRQHKLGSLEPKYRRGPVHPRSVSPKVEKLVLDFVVRDPEASIHKIRRGLRAHGIVISSSGVYKILVKHNLQVRELRYAFSFSHPAGTLYAAHISPRFRKKLIEDYLYGQVSISAICRNWGVSRRTFYKWLSRYQEAAGIKDASTSEESKPFRVNLQGEPTPGVFKNVVEALAKRYRRGVNHQNSIGEDARQAVIDVIRSNPYFSVHKIHAEIARDQNLPKVGHAAIQNLLTREGLNTVAKRLDFAGGYMPEPQVVVAPQYVPEIPVYKWRMLFAPFVTIPKLMATNPRQGLTLLATISLPLFAFVIFTRSIFNASRETSLVGMFFASVALLFGLFFFVYSLKYYASIFMVLKLAQSGSTNSPTSGESKPTPEVSLSASGGRI